MSRRKSNGGSEICYLCGAAIIDDRSKDHVPPKQFLAKSLRRRYNPDRLTTLPSHGACNGSYKLDEEYFTQALAPVAMESEAAAAVVQDFADKHKAGKTKLGRKILSEFERRPSGLHLPRDVVLKRLEGSRIRRVAWKVARGLYAIENASVLPESTPFELELIEPKHVGSARHEEVWEIVKVQPSKGVYQGVFAYKYLQVTDETRTHHAWGMLLWDRIMLFIAHPSPGEHSGQGRPQDSGQCP